MQGKPWQAMHRVLMFGAVGVGLLLIVLALGFAGGRVEAIPGGSISGTVFFDADGDGVQGPGERGLLGVTLSLTGPGPDATVVTHDAGFYQFDGLSPGTYTVVETDPTGYLSTTPNAVSVSLRHNEARDGVNFGDALPVTLTGVVFEDWDQDGQQGCQQGNCEPGIAGAAVTLYPDANRDRVQDPGALPVATATSFEVDGGYVIPGLLPAWYVLVVKPPPGYVNTTPDVLPLTLVSGEVAGARAPDVGLVRLVVLAGSVFLDDGDGVRAAGELGLNGAVVVLSNVKTGESRHTVSNEDGGFRFDRLLPGASKVSVEPGSLPAGLYYTGGTEPLHLELSPGEEERADLGYGDCQCKGLLDLMLRYQAQPGGLSLVDAFAYEGRQSKGKRPFASKSLSDGDTFDLTGFQGKDNLLPREITVQLFSHEGSEPFETWTLDTTSLILNQRFGSLSVDSLTRLLRKCRPGDE